MWFKLYPASHPVHAGIALSQISIWKELLIGMPSIMKTVMILEGFHCSGFRWILVTHEGWNAVYRGFYSPTRMKFTRNTDYFDFIKKKTGYCHKRVPQQNVSNLLSKTPICPHLVLAHVGVSVPAKCGKSQTF